MKLKPHHTGNGEKSRETTILIDSNNNECDHVRIPRTLMMMVHYIILFYFPSLLRVYKKFGPNTIKNTGKEAFIHVFLMIFHNTILSVISRNMFPLIISEFNLTWRESFNSSD